jgi:hypothetical protein
MKSKLIMSGLLALTLSSMTADACRLPIRIACPNDNALAGVRVYIAGVGEGVTDGLGIVEIEVPWLGSTYTVCVDATTLPAGVSLSKPCQEIKVLTDAPPVVEFSVRGDFCDTPPPPGDCWLTGGGTVGKTKGVADYSFGGVVYPGCSPKAADGGNWNVVAHAAGLHFQGQQIIVDSCSGVSTRSPRVNVNIIDFHGTGIIAGVAGNGTPTTPVTFVGRAIDNLESGGGNDMLYLRVTDGSGTVLQIGSSTADPAVISTGNLQIHTTSCK